MAIEILRRRPVAELQPSKAALRLIATFEGLSLKAYRDSVGILTAGYGHTGPDVLEGMQITLAQADQWLEEDIAEAWGIVQNAVQVPLTQGEADALTSLAYNLGKVPRSMLACLNGGTTDKGEVMAPGSYGSALKQFPRNCRAGGIPLRGLYRRRLAEACVFSDLPYENACSISVVKLELDSAGNIDPIATTSLEDTLARARQDVPIQRPPFDFSKPFPEPVKPQDELVLTNVQPAAPPKAEATGQEPMSQVTSPPPLAPVPPSQNTGASPPASRPAPASVAPPPSPVGAGASTLPPPRKIDPPVPIGQQTSAVDATRKADEWSANAKSMVYSRRFWGLLLVVVGRVWMLKTGSNAVLGAVSDPLVMEMFSGFMVMIIGEVVQHWGEKKATRPLK